MEDLGCKMRRETEIALTYGLTFPDRVPPIPTIEVGIGEFDPEFAEQYWAERLELNHWPGRKRRCKWSLTLRLDRRFCELYLRIYDS